MSDTKENLIGERRRANLWQEVGGDPTFRTLVEAFYRKVEADPILRPLFPTDLSEGREKQLLFLVQYFGGPPRYDERHGHPRLRLRHLPFRIGGTERDRWLALMLEAVDETHIREPWRTAMREYFETASQAMINVVGSG